MGETCKSCGFTNSGKTLRGPKGEKGDPGPAGPPGQGGNVNVVGVDDIVVTSSTVNGTTTYTVGRPKDFMYQEVVSTQDVDDGTFQYHFPTGYAVLEFTNTSAVPKTYKAFANYDTNFTVMSNQAAVSNWVDGAIIKTVSGVDTVLTQSLGLTVLNVNLYNGPLSGDVIDVDTLEYVVDNLGNKVEVRLTNSSFPRNVALFCPVTLQPGEKVSLKFKAKPSEVSKLLRAAFMVEEL